MVHLDPPSASQDAVAAGDSPPGEIPEPTEELAAGDSPSGEIPEATEEPAAGDSPPGEMPVADDAAEVPEYLPPGKKSKTEAREEEDVEMQAEEPPQDDPMDATDDAPDFGDLDINDEYSDTESVMVRRADELINSEVYESTNILQMKKTLKVSQVIFNKDLEWLHRLWRDLFTTCLAEIRLLLTTLSKQTKKEDNDDMKNVYHLCRLR